MIKPMIYLAAVASATTGVSVPLYPQQSVLRSFSQVEIDAIEIPRLLVRTSQDDDPNNEKYYYFHREETDFVTAFDDVSECDALADGRRYYRASDASSSFGTGVGVALGMMLDDVIFGSGRRRELRRVNMRNCMHFKGYDRYGVAKSVWKDFNFEEGLRVISGHLHQPAELSDYLPTSEVVD